MSRKEEDEEKESRASKYSISTSLFMYSMMMAFGQFRDYFGALFGTSRYLDSLISDGFDENGKLIKFPRLIPAQKGLYIRRVFNRLRECFDRPICSSPGSRIDILPRKSYDGGRSLEVEEGLLNRELQAVAKQDGRINNCLNLGSYNYLGFADNWTETCGPSVLPVLSEMGIVAGSTSLEAGRTYIHRELEEYVSRFLHKESAIVFSMGYGTNATSLAALLTPGSVVLSDSLNHTSIVNGCRSAHEVKIVPFKHNNMRELEKYLQLLVLCGRSYPKLEEAEVYKPWDKLVVVVEGIYSMEGEASKLKAVNELCKKYKAYLFVDEAHSIGALGATGRGICEHSGVPFSEVDILMGTFSKSFGGMGGYIAGTKKDIDALRARCAGTTTMSPLSTLVTRQVLTAFKIIDSKTGIGPEKLKALKDNSNYFRRKLIKMGCTVLGDNDSPIVPVMLYQPSKLYAFSMEMLKRNVAVVVVAYPATKMEEARVRFCISAGQSKEDLKQALKDIEVVARMLNLRYEKNVL